MYAVFNAVVALRVGQPGTGLPSLVFKPPSLVFCPPSLAHPVFWLIKLLNPLTFLCLVLSVFCGLRMY